MAIDGTGSAHPSVLYFFYCGTIPYLRTVKTLLTTLNAKYIHSNLAIRLLYQLYKETYEGLAWKEYTIKEDRDIVAAECAAYDLVAFSCYIWNITQTLDLCARIKKINPHTIILLGGPEVSYEWEEVIALPQIDYIITGEGEIPFGHFLAGYPHTSGIANLVQKDSDGKIIYEPITQNFPLEEYACIDPYADEDALDLAHKVLYIETSRGCPYKCEFCLASLDNKVRYLPMDRIKKNLLHLMQEGRTIKFLDRTFNMKRDFTLEIFQFILDHHRPGNIFQFEITADILHPDIIRFIDEHIPPGLFRFEIGIQTVNQKANLEVGRKQNFDKTKDIIHRIRHKIETHLDLIIGLPLDYWENTRYSFEEVFRLFAPELQMGFLKFLKGTTMRDKEAHGFVFDPAPPYQLIESKYLSREQLHLLENTEQALEIYWNKGRAIHTLTYIATHFSSFDFLLGLGNAFELRSDFHRHSLDEVYNILIRYVQTHFPEDNILPQLISIDHLMFHKIKPKTLLITEWNGAVKNDWLLKQGLCPHQFRYALLALTFDFSHFMHTQEIIMGPYLLCIQFTGTAKSEIISCLPQEARLLVG